MSFAASVIEEDAFVEITQNQDRFKEDASSKEGTSSSTESKELFTHHESMDDDLIIISPIAQIHKPPIGLN